MNVLIELAFFEGNPVLHTFEHLWIIEQDVAWQGNLFDILSPVESWKEDHICSFGLYTFESTPLNASMSVGLLNSSDGYGQHRFVKVSSNLPKKSSDVLT